MMTNYKFFHIPTGSRQFSMSGWRSSVVFSAVAVRILSASAALATLMPVEAAECPLPHRSGERCLASVSASAQEQKLRVGVAGSAPFVIEDEGKIKGISIDIWKTLASAEEFDYELIPHQNVAAGLNALAQGKLDVLIGPISLTPQRLAREEIEFTQPYFVSHFGLLLAAQRPTLWSRVAPLFGLAALSSIVLLLFLLFIVGHLIWLAERKSNPEQFPPDYVDGVRNGIWFALVTFTTVGYGDRAPVTKAGQAIAGIWMVVTLVTVSSFTAGLASAFTAIISGEKARERFRTLQALPGARMAVVAGTAGADWAQDYQAILTPRETLEEAIAMVVTGKTEGVIFDRPALQYYVRTHPELKLRVSPLILATDSYHFVVAANNAAKEKKLNVQLLGLRSERRIPEFDEKWIAQKWLDISNSEAR